MLKYISILTGDIIMTTEEYIDHEVRLRVNDEKFKAHDEKFDRLESRLNWIIGLVVGSWILPIILHAVKLV